MSDQNTPDPDHLDERDEALVSEFADRLAKPVEPAPVDDEVFHYRVEFEGPDSVTCLILADNEQPALYLDEDARTISVKVGDRVEAIISRRRFVAMFRVGCSGDDDNGGGGEDPDGPDDGPDGPDLDGLAAWVDGDGITHLRTDQGTSSIMGRRDEVTERRAA